MTSNLSVESKSSAQFKLEISVLIGDHGNYLYFRMNRDLKRAARLKGSHKLKVFTDFREYRGFIKKGDFKNSNGFLWRCPEGFIVFTLIPVDPMEQILDLDPRKFIEIPIRFEDSTKTIFYDLPFVC
jgi:hypothetical protein